MTSRTALRLLALAVAVFALTAVASQVARRSSGAARSTPPAQTAAAPRAPPSAAERQASALAACTERADYLFVRRCQQSCQVEAKGKDPSKALACVAACGKQPQRTEFVEDCVAKAGHP
jgi:hypothetical protein